MWNGSDRGKCGMVVTRGMVEWYRQGEMWNGSDRGNGEMVVTGEMVEWY